MKIRLANHNKSIRRFTFLGYNRGFIFRKFLVRQLIWRIELAL